MELDNVKPVKFERYFIADEGEKVIFQVRDKKGNIGHIAVDWLHLSIVVQLIRQGADEASEARHSLGKSDDIRRDSKITPQVVSGFQVSEFPEKKLKILSLQSPAGFRADFAIPTDGVDQLGRSLHQAIAEELLQVTSKTRQKPN